MENNIVNHLDMENKSFNTKKTFFAKIYIVSCIIVFYACQSNNTNTVSPENSDTLNLDTIRINNPVESDKIYPDSSSSVNYLFPSPDEILSEILSSKIEFDLTIINSNKIANKYIETKKQALNLGVYLTDLAYINLYGDKNMALLYFKTVRDLAQKINIYNLFDEEMYNRIQNNLANNDSLNQIIKTMYNDIMELLESTERNNIYTLVVSGALIEALYISTMHISDFNEFKPVATKIFEQKYVINNFYEFASQYKKDANVRDVLLIFDNFKTILEGENTETSEKTVLQNEKNNYVISGGEDIIVTEKQFNRFKNSVLNIRTEIVR